MNDSTLRDSRLTEQVAAYARATQFAKLPAEVVERAKRGPKNRKNFDVECDLIFDESIFCQASGGATMNWSLPRSDQVVLQLEFTPDLPKVLGLANAAG